PAGGRPRPLATTRPQTPDGWRASIMMGGHHATSGAATWLALTGTATIGDRALGAGLLDLTGPEVLAGAVVATGAALLPDIDHPTATIARSAHAAVSSATGHRGATHSLLAVAVFTLVGALASRLDVSWHVPIAGQVQLGTVIVVTALCAIAVRALKVVRGALLPWVIGLGCGL